MPVPRVSWLRAFAAKLQGYLHGNAWDAGVRMRSRSTCAC